MIINSEDTANLIYSIWASWWIVRRHTLTQPKWNCGDSWDVFVRFPVDTTTWCGFSEVALPRIAQVYEFKRRWNLREISSYIRQRDRSENKSDELHTTIAYVTHWWDSTCTPFIYPCVVVETDDQRWSTILGLTHLPENVLEYYRDREKTEMKREHDGRVLRGGANKITRETQTRTRLTARDLKTVIHERLSFAVFLTHIQTLSTLFRFSS